MYVCPITIKSKDQTMGKHFLDICPENEGENTKHRFDSFNFLKIKKKWGKTRKEIHFFLNKITQNKHLAY